MTPDYATNIPLEPQELVEWSGSKALKSAFEKIGPSTWELSPEELEKQAAPTQTDYLIKSAFWNEVRICMADSIPFLTTRVCKGICSYQNFFHHIINNPVKLAWLLSPLYDVQVAMKSYSLLVLNRLREVLTADWRNEDGNINQGLVKTWLNILRTLQTTPDPPPITENSVNRWPGEKPLKCLTMDELEEKLRRLRENEGA